MRRTILPLLAITACGHLSTPWTRSAVAVPIQVVLAPTAVAVGPQDSARFRATVVWSDHRDHPATITYATSTGATVSYGGVVRAPAGSGSYQITAVCDCGLTDSAVMVVGTIANGAPQAQIAVRVSGLPDGSVASVVLQDAHGGRRIIGANGSAGPVPPGEYTIAAESVPHGGTTYATLAALQQVTVFTGDSAVVSVTYQPVLPTSGLPPHPRVWMNPARLATLRAQAASHSARWHVVLSAADTMLTQHRPVKANDESALPNLCTAYLGTHNPAYAIRAGLIIDSLLVPRNDLREDFGYDYRSTMPHVTIGLDWCYEGLTTEQRHRAATWLMDRADWAWPESTPTRLIGWGLHPDNNYFWGFMQTGPAALAAAEDDTGSSWLSGHDRPRFHEQLALQRWVHDALPLFAGDVAGGAWTEGTGYDSAWPIGRFVDAFQTAGVPLSTQWLQESLTWRLHSTMPDFRHKVPLGDQARISDAPLYQYDREAALSVLAAAHAGPSTHAAIQRWLADIGEVPDGRNGAADAVDELIYYDPSVAPAPSLAVLPLSYLAAGGGNFVYRTSWTDSSAMALVFHSGPVRPDHSSLDANALMIWAGGFWITANANIWSLSGIEQASEDYNTLTVDGRGQSHRSEGTGAILATQTAADLVAVRGQAASAYGVGLVAPVTDDSRTVAFLPDAGTVVVVDRVTTRDRRAQKTWRWHAVHEPVFSGNSFRLDNPDRTASCIGQVFGSEPPMLSRDVYRLEHDPSRITSYALTITATDSAATSTVVTVLQCGPPIRAQLAVAAILDERVTTVHIGTITLAVPWDPTQPVYRQ
jgi:hypothetical protein